MFGSQKPHLTPWDEFERQSMANDTLGVDVSLYLNWFKVHELDTNSLVNGWLFHNGNQVVTMPPNLWLDENHQLVFSEIDGNLSVSENQLAASISVYPNPSKEIINININTINIDEVIVLNSKGSEVIRKKTDYNKIDISKLTSGIYFLRIKSKKGVFTTKKIIKN